MEQPLKDLLLLLEDETNLHRTLLEILKKERQALVDMQLNDIGRYCKLKENQILKIKILEEQRTLLMNRLSAAYGGSESNLNLTQLAERVNILYAQRLMDVGAALAEILQQIKRLNDANRSLITFSQEIIAGSLAIFENLTAPEPVYQPNGYLKQFDKSGKIMTRVV